MEVVEESSELWTPLINVQRQLSKKEIQTIEPLFESARGLIEPNITLNFEDQKIEGKEQWMTTHFVAQLFEMYDAPVFRRTVKDELTGTEHQEFKVIEEMRMNVRTGKIEPRD